MYDRTGTVLLARFECQNRESVRFDEIPNIVVDATVASEDKTFWTNNGVDVQAAAGAAPTSGRIHRPGRIHHHPAGDQVRRLDRPTQEQTDDALIVPSIAPIIDEGGEEPAPDEVCPPPRLTFLEGRGFEDKIREQIMAMQVTAAYPGREGKELILATYLNLIFYGNGSQDQGRGGELLRVDRSVRADAQPGVLGRVAPATSAPRPIPECGRPAGPAEAAADAMRERDGVLLGCSRTSTSRSTSTRPPPRRPGRR